MTERLGGEAAAAASPPGIASGRLERSVEVRGVTKVYGTTVANEAMSLEIRRGEIHGLLGQNGAGKSTLVGVLTGHVQPDAGEVLADGEPIDLSSGEAALDAGIAGVYQTPMLVGSMTGLENVALALGEAPTDAVRRRLKRMADEVGLPIELDVAVDRLDMAARLRIEFIRALCQEPRVLLLDEPTTFLPPTQVDEFLGGIRRLADSGMAVLMITHRLDEARRVCDRVTIIRSGTVVADYGHDELPDNHAIAVAMLGEEVSEPVATGTARDDVALRVVGLQSPPADEADVELEGIDLEVFAGEIVGIAGVDGNGQIDLLEAMAGARATSGTVELAGRDLSGQSYVARFHAGLQLLSGDRRRHGIVPELSVYQHFDFALDHPAREEVLRRLSDYNTRPLALDVPATTLSGGNQQKVMLARALMSEPRVLLLAHPTQGLDVSAAARIHSALIEHARQGVALVIVSSDLDELLGLCDRVLVMYRGRIVGAQQRGAIDRPQLARWFTGTASNEEAELVGN